MNASPQRDADGLAAATPVVITLPAQVSGPYLQAVRRQLHAGLQHPGGLVVDCRQVQDAAPAALALLVAAYRTARLRGVTWRLEQPTAAMFNALRRSGLSHLLVPLPGPALGPPQDPPPARPSRHAAAPGRASAR